MMADGLSVVVTGREGQVARALREAGPALGVTVRNVGRPALDLAHPDSIAQVIVRAQPDIVINAAAYTMVDKAEGEPEAARAVNATGAGHVAAACAALNVPVIHISTDYVFDGTAEGLYREEDPVAPANVYGATKLEGEQLVAARNPQHIIVRTAWVHSPWGHNFVKTMLRLAQSRSALSVVDDQRGCPTYAPHLAQVLLGIAGHIKDKAAGEPWGIYHAVGTGETTWCGLARAVFDEARRHGLPAAEVAPTTTAHYPTPARRPMNSRLSCAKLERVFGLALPSWQDGVAQSVACLAQSSDGP